MCHRNSIVFQRSHEITRIWFFCPWHSFCALYIIVVVLLLYSNNIHSFSLSFFFRSFVCSFINSLMPFGRSALLAYLKYLTCRWFIANDDCKCDKIPENYLRYELETVWNMGKVIASNFASWEDCIFFKSNITATLIAYSFIESPRYVPYSVFEFSVFAKSLQAGYDLNFSNGLRLNAIRHRKI